MYPSVTFEQRHPEYLTAHSLESEHAYVKQNEFMTWNNYFYANCFIFSLSNVHYLSRWQKQLPLASSLVFLDCGTVQQIRSRQFYLNIIAVCNINLLPSPMATKFIRYVSFNKIIQRCKRQSKAQRKVPWAASGEDLTCSDKRSNSLSEATATTRRT